MKILVVSDIHGNPDALKAALNKYQKKVDTVWALGDYMGFCPEPEKVVEILKKIPNLISVKGNWEHLYLINFDPRTFKGVPGNATKEDLVKVVEDGMKRITPEMKRYFIGLPDCLEFELNGYTFSLSHCGPHDPFDGFVEDEKGMTQAAKATKADFILTGDMHVQRKVKLNGKTFLNPGAVSWPSSGKMGANCLVITVDKKGVSFEFDNVPYDYKKVYKKLEKINLPRRQNFLKAKPLWD